MLEINEVLLWWQLKLLESRFSKKEEKGCTIEHGKNISEI